MTGLDVENPFWRFSLEVYAAPSVVPECLALQEQLGLDVNIALFVAWLGLKGTEIRPDDLARITETAATWSHDVVKPLRRARRQLKSLAGDTIAVQDLHKRVANAELFAEQIEQAQLHEIAGKLGTAARVPAMAAAQANIAALLAAHGSDGAAFPLKNFWAACAAHAGNSPQS